MLSRPLLCPQLLCGIRICSNWRFHCCSSVWDTVNLFLPNTPKLLLLRLYYRHNAAVTIILFIFCCIGFTSSITPLLCCCLNCHAHQIPYALLPLYTIPVALPLLLFYPYQPMSPLLSSYVTISIIPNISYSTILDVLHIWYIPYYIVSISRVSTATLSIGPNISAILWLLL